MATSPETPQDGNSIELHVKNFGPIVEANIELRPLTVFVGPSNTGKSYLASLILALHNSFKPKKDFFSFSESFRGNIESYKMTPAQIKNVSNWMMNKFKSDMSKDEIAAETERTIPANIINLLNNFLKFKYTENYSITSEIARSFGIDSPNNLIRKTSGDETFSLSIINNFKDHNCSFNVELEIEKDARNFSISIPRKITQCIDIKPLFAALTQTNTIKLMENTSIPENFVAEMILSMLAEPIFDLSIDPLSKPGYYLPADRTGVMHAHQVVTSSLIRRSSIAAIHSFPNVPTLSGVLGDFLEQLVQLSQTSENGGDYNEIAKDLEKIILEGKIYSTGEYSKDIPYPFFTFQPKGWKNRLPLMNASSMVSELAPVVLYLRHVIKPGNVLIIEEPESHMHPSKQVEFTRYLALLVKKGIRIIVTTHSEWVIEALGNIVQASILPEDQRNDLPSEDFALDRDQVGVWLFKPKNRPKGSVVTEIEIDNDSGNFQVGYNEVMESLFDEWTNTFNRLENLKAR